MKPHHKAHIAIFIDGTIQAATAAFVYLTPTGFAWIEPGYDEIPLTRRRLHVIEGALTAMADGFMCETGGEDAVYLVTGQEHMDGTEWLATAGAELDAMEAELAARGVSLDQERARLKEQVDREVAFLATSAEPQDVVDGLV